MKRLVIGPASLRFQIRFQSAGLRGKQESPGTPAMARKEKYISLLMESRRRSLRPARPVQNRRHGLLPVKLINSGSMREQSIRHCSKRLTLSEQNFNFPKVETLCAAFLTRRQKI